MSSLDRCAENCVPLTLYFAERSGQRTAFVIYSTELQLLFLLYGISFAGTRGEWAVKLVNRYFCFCFALLLLVVYPVENRRSASCRVGFASCCHSLLTRFLYSTAISPLFGTPNWSVLGKCPFLSSLFSFLSGFYNPGCEEDWQRNTACRAKVLEWSGTGAGCYVMLYGGKALVRE